MTRDIERTTTNTRQRSRVTPREGRPKAETNTQAALIGPFDTEWISQSQGVAELPFMRVWHKQEVA